MATDSPPLPSESCSPASIVPIEIVSDDEMSFLKAALASARPLTSSSLAAASLSRYPLVSSPPLALSPSRRHVTSGGSDIEDSGRPKSLLARFRAHRALAVTDLTGSEWCQKKKQFELERGKPERTAAMEAGSNRHLQLEKEIMEKRDICVESLEESWAVKFLNFIVGAQQLLFQGLTRELPVIGVFGDTWLVGIIDELRMPINGASPNPILVDTKTRYKATLPTEAQKRNARLQLMCYKYLWDSLAVGTFPTENFFKHFQLNSQYILSEDVKQYSASLGFDTKTFEDVVTCFKNSCSIVCPSHDQLLLRYELQSDFSLLEEHQFAYDAGWLKSQIEENLKFWLGEKEADYVSHSERWKCGFCQFKTECSPRFDQDDMKRMW